MTISLAAFAERSAAIAPLDGVDECSLTGEAAVDWLARVGEVRQAIDVVIATVAHRVELLSAPDSPDGRFARRQGFAGPAGLVAEAADLGLADAGKLLGLGAVLAAGERADALQGSDDTAGLPDRAASTPFQPTPLERFAYLARAVRNGSLGLEKATIIRRTLEDFTIDTAQIEVSLVDRARKRAIGAVRRMCQQELARSDQRALVEREERNRAARYVKFYDEADGTVTLRGKLDAITAAPLRTVIDAQVRAQMNTERELKAGERREPGQIAADVMAGMARHYLGCEDEAKGVKTTMVVRVDLADLEAGVGAATCDSFGPPISIETLRAMAVDAQVIPAVMGGSSFPLDLGHAKRLYTRAQRLAIAERDGGCARCGAPVARCDVHHIKWWSAGGRTDLANGVLLCVGCHHRLHDYHWDIEIDPDDTVWFIPPASVDPHRRRQPAGSARLPA